MGENKMKTVLDVLSVSDKELLDKLELPDDVNELKYLVYSSVWSRAFADYVNETGHVNIEAINHFMLIRYKRIKEGLVSLQEKLRVEANNEA